MATDKIVSTKKLFLHYKSLAEKSFAQISDDDIKWAPNDSSNSIAVIVHHLSGNMLSRFTDFLSTDGEKPWRDREAEFAEGYGDKAHMLEAWEKGWETLITALDSVTDTDLERIVFVRNEGHTVFEAFQRQLAHYASHIGQIIYIAKALKGSEFKSLSIPKGESAAFNQEMFSKEKSQKHFTDKP
jgi:hypothetical protein